ncbi:MAG: endonuclease domain-containing protein [Sphingomicrobium sp.]
MSLERARSLRKRMTPPERRLWNVLRSRPETFKFRRQHPLGPYTLDFFCYEAALAIEIDGLAHELGSNPQRDIRRDKWVAEQGVRTLRFRATDIRDNLDGVVTLIVQECLHRSPRKEGPSTAFGGPPPLQVQGRIEGGA